jgi:hypothetical protein
LIKVWDVKHLKHEINTGRKGKRKGQFYCQRYHPLEILHFAADSNSTPKQSRTISETNTYIRHISYRCCIPCTYVSIKPRIFKHL